MKYIRQHILFLLGCVFIICTETHAADNFDPVSSSFRMLWGLVVVLAVIFLLYAILRKKVSALQYNDKGVIKVLEVKHIMPKKSLMLIEVRGQEFVVGAGNDSIHSIVPLHQSNSFSTILKKSEDKISL